MAESPSRSMGVMTPGAEVEVCLDDKGYYGTWCEATVVDFAAAHGGHAPMQYRITLDGNRERQLDPTHVRPRPPALESLPHFRPHDIVEVIHKQGLWSGLVLSANPTSVTVAFPITREVITYMPHLVRPRRDYIDGVWVPSQAVVAVRPKHKIRGYKVGEEVEVVREREVYGHSWFPAKVVEVIDEFSYIVKYANQNREEGGSSEYLHWQFIRPARSLRPKNELPLHLGPRAAVEAYCDGAWSAGLVHKIHEDGKFVVRFNGRQGKQLMTKEVRRQYKWDGMDWSIGSTKRQAKQALASGRHPKRLMKAQQKLPVLAVQYSENDSDSKMGTPFSTVEIGLRSTCPPNSCSPLYGDSTHPKNVVSGNVEDQLERKRAPFLHKIISSKKRLSKKNESFEGLHSLHGPLELSSTGQNTGVNEIAGSLREPSLVLERSEFTQQQYDLFVRSIWQSKITDSEGSIEQKKRTLAALKIKGFDVQRYEPLLDELIEVKLEYSKQLEEKSAIQTKKQEASNSLDQKDSSLCEIENDIAELEMKLGVLRQELQRIEKNREQDEKNVSTLEQLESDIDDNLDANIQKFNGILAEAQQMPNLKCST